MNIKADSYIKMYFDNYHEATPTRKKKKRNLKNEKIQKIANKRHCLLSSFYPLEVAFLKLVK